MIWQLCRFDYESKYLSDFMKLKNSQEIEWNKADLKTQDNEMHLINPSCEN